MRFKIQLKFKLDKYKTIIVLLEFDSIDNEKSLDTIFKTKKKLNKFEQ